MYVLGLPVLNYSACKFPSQFFYYRFCLVHTVQVDYNTKAQGLENSEISCMLFIYCLKIIIYLLLQVLYFSPTLLFSVSVSLLITNNFFKRCKQNYC